MSGFISTSSARLLGAMGGRARARVIATLAAVLALDAADKGTIGATAVNIEHAFSVGKTELGLLFTVTSLVGALATLGFGTLVDRVRRTRLLVVVIVVWAIAMVSAAAATSYAWLLCSQMFLAGITAAGYPAIASLIGDWFPPSERGRILGMVLAGELVGTGIGIALSGELASVASWRLSFLSLAIPAVVVAWFVQRLGEPARGGADHLLAEHLDLSGSPSQAAIGDTPRGEHEADLSGETHPERADTALGPMVAEAGIDPDQEAVLTDDLADLPFTSAVRYVLRIRTNVILIVASAMGYYLFAGVRAFGVEFAGEHYGIGQGLASGLVLILGSGAVVGVLVGGSLSDRLLGRMLDARIVVPSIAFIAAAVSFAPAMIFSSVAAGLPLLMAAGFFLAVTNPPLDAARLDVVPPRLWGRAEAIRTVARGSLEALAPLAFGTMAQYLFGNRGGEALRDTFLIMTVPLIGGGLILLLARRSYLTDVATAAASAANDE